MQYSDIFGQIVSDAWLIFMIVWAISAIFAKRTVKKGWNTWWLWPIRIVFVAIVISLVTFTGKKGAILFIYIHSPVLRGIGDILVILGITLAIWARFYLGRNWGQPMSEKANAELVTTGPYAYIRHPIYAGIFLSLFGSVLVFGLLWALVLVISASYFLIAIGREDEIMAELFPDTYPAYKARTKKMIPLVW